ncbi:MAG: hypothetical protein HFH06_07595 [Lachnospiraceae bacterium]|nr:hypothetical protein [Lachnospiraceae bacterium]
MAGGKKAEKPIVLSKRMQMLADMVTAGSRIADVGCDHAFLSVYLIQAGKCPKCLAMDVRRGPLSGAEEHIAAYGLGEYIETRLSDGLAAYRIGEAQTLVCSGMGGRLMKRILEEGGDKTRSFTELILQPQSEIPEFRIFLREAGFLVTEEEAVYEEGKYYFAIKAVYAGQKKPIQQNILSEVSESAGQGMPLGSGGPGEHRMPLGSGEAGEHRMPLGSGEAGEHRMPLGSGGPGESRMPLGSGEAGEHRMPLGSGGPGESRMPLGPVGAEEQRGIPAGSVSPEQNAAPEKEPPAEKALYDLYGEQLLRRKHPVLRQYLLNGVETVEKIIAQLEGQDSPKGEIRLRELQQEKRQLEKALEFWGKGR